MDGGSQRRGAVRALILGALTLGGAAACTVDQHTGLSGGDAARPADGAATARDGGADAAPVPRTGTAPVPRAGDRSAALWTCGGGGVATAAGGQVGVVLGTTSGQAPVRAGAGQLTPGHFVDTVE